MDAEHHLALTSFLSGGVVIEIIILIFFILLSALMSVYASSLSMLSSDELRELRYARDKRSLSTRFRDTDNLNPKIAFIRSILSVTVICLAAVISFSIFKTGTTGKHGFLSGILLIFIILIALEILPRIYSGRHHFQIVKTLDPLLSFFLKIFHPITSVLHLKPLPYNDGNDFQDSSDPIEKDTIIRGIANFGNTSVSAIMCPRIDVTAVDVKWGFEKIIPVIINSGFSRIPVYSVSFDTVRGILYAKDVLPYSNNPANFKWQALMRPPYFVPETKKINELLKDFQLRKIHMAIVIDEYGGTSGIVTLEDILEEIVGEITDENDEEITLFRKIDEKKFIFEGKILINNFCKVFGIEESYFSQVRGESETLAGLLLELAGEIPQKDQVIKYHDFIFTVESVDRRRIKEIIVETEKKNEKQDEV